jgi:hypothetical protein
MPMADVSRQVSPARIAERVFLLESEAVSKINRAAIRVTGSEL